MKLLGLAMMGLMGGASMAEIPPPFYVSCSSDDSSVLISNAEDPQPVSCQDWTNSTEPSVCTCAHWFDSAWFCITPEEPCSDVPSRPEYPTVTQRVEMSAKRANVEGYYQDSTGFLVHDQENNRERLDTVVYEKIMTTSQGVKFNTFHSSKVTLDNTTRGIVRSDESVPYDEGVVVASCAAASSSAVFAASPLAGSVNRYLPDGPSASKYVFAQVHADRFLGYSDDGAQRWGWYEDTEPWQTMASHMVVVHAAGYAVSETQSEVYAGEHEVALTFSAPLVDDLFPASASTPAFEYPSPCDNDGADDGSGDVAPNGQPAKAAIN